LLVISVTKCQEVLDTITREARQRGITDAAIVSLIGAVESCCVSVMPKTAPLEDILTDYDQPLELSGTGEIVDGKVHLHAVLGDQDGTVSGHLHWAKVDRWFVRAYLMPV
jgi:predicted DNA-binding protein with PD1-like motif